MANEAVTWNANQPFYEHMRSEIWDKLRESDSIFNHSEGVDKLDALEDILSAVKHWFSMIEFYGNQEEVDRIKGLFDSIETLSNGNEFSAMRTSDEENYKIKLMLDEIRRQLWLLISRNGMTPTRRETTGREVWM